MKITTISKVALVSALYVAVTIILAPLSFGAVQLRASELFNHLAAFNKRYILAVAIGCAIANMFSPLGIVDVLFGTVGTLIGTSLTYFFARHTQNTVKKLAIATICQIPAMLPIALEYRNACMYGHSHKLTRFELQAELRKIDEKHGLDYKEGVDYNMFNDNQQHINYKSYTMGLRYNQLKSENNGTV